MNHQQNIYRTSLTDHPYNLISINSSDGIGTNTNFRVSLDYNITPSHIVLCHLAFPNTIYNFGYDAIILDEFGFGPVSVNVPIGIYEVLALSPNPIGPALAAALTAASPGGNIYTVTIDTLLAKFIITAGGAAVPFKFGTVANPINPRDNMTYYHLGFNSQYPLDVVQAYALSQTSSGQFNLIPVRNNVYVRIRELDNRNESCRQNGFTFCVPSISISRQSAGFSMGNKFAQYYVNTSRRTFKELSIQLVDDRGVELHLASEINIILGYFDTY